MTPAKTILVVDDDASLRAGLGTMLQQHGYQSLEAEDGLDARTLIEEHAPDLVVLDMMMPRWGGFALLEHFLGMIDAPPFIMITASEGEKHRKYAAKVGVADYLKKPFTFHHLLSRINHVLGVPAPAAAPTATVERPIAAAQARDGRSMRITCPACSARIKAPAQLLWRKRPCPRCQHPLTIQPELPSDEGPQLVMMNA